jgi:hypothetical protein
MIKPLIDLSGEAIKLPTAARGGGCHLLRAARRADAAL